MEDYGCGGRCGEVEASSCLRGSEFGTLRCVANSLLLIRVPRDLFLFRSSTLKF